MTRIPPQLAADAADEEMLAALERAGVDMNMLARLSTDNGLLIVERDDLHQELVFRKARDCPEGTKRIWRWRIWGSSDPQSLSRVRLFDLGGGWEPDVASMVARVVAFLGMGKP